MPKLTLMSTPEGVINGYIIQSSRHKSGREWITIIREDAAMAHFWEDEVVSL